MPANNHSASPMPSELTLLLAAVSLARLRCQASEAKRRREGGIYDPLLKRFVSMEDARETTRRTAR